MGSIPNANPMHQDAQIDLEVYSRATEVHTNYGEAVPGIHSDPRNTPSAAGPRVQQKKKKKNTKCVNEKRKQKRLFSVASTLPTKRRVLRDRDPPLRRRAPHLVEELGALVGLDGERLQAGEQALALRDEELRAARHTREHDRARVEARERRDAPVVRVVELDALQDGDAPGVRVLAVRRARRGVRVVRRVPAHAEREAREAPEHARRDVLRDRRDVHPRALPQHEPPQRRRRPPARLVRKRVAQVEPDAHREVERLQRGQPVPYFAECGEVQRERAEEAHAAETRWVVVEKVLDEPVPPCFGNGHLRGLTIVGVRFEEGVAGLDGF